MIEEQTWPRVVLKTARYTYYEISPGVFNTDPKAVGGYAILASLRVLKNDA